MEQEKLRIWTLFTQGYTRNIANEDDVMLFLTEICSLH